MLIDSINAGFSMTSSGETFFSPVKSGIFLSNNRSAKSNGDKAVMRRLDKLVESHPDTYRLEKQDEVSKTYSMPKSCVTYRKPRNLTDEQREQARERLQKIKNADK